MTLNVDKKNALKAWREADNKESRCLKIYTAKKYLPIKT